METLNEGDIVTLIKAGQRIAVSREGLAGCICTRKLEEYRLSDNRYLQVAWNDGNSQPQLVAYHLSVESLTYWNV